MMLGNPNVLAMLIQIFAAYLNVQAADFSDSSTDSSGYDTERDSEDDD